MNKQSLTAIVGGVLAAIFLGLTASANTPFVTIRYVKPTGTDNPTCSIAQPCRKIRHAIQVAQSGDTIVVGAGLYRERLRINKNLKIRGQGPDAPVVSGGGTRRVIEVQFGVTAKLINLTIKDGFADHGGGILNLGTLKVRNVVIGTSAAEVGGGVMNGGRLRMKKSILQRNSASVYGAGLHNSAVATLVAVSVFGNTAPDSAGISNGGTLKLLQSTIEGNTATTAGYAGLANSGQATLVNVTVSSNTATGVGGGIGLNPNAIASLTNVTITDNTASSGGGIYLIDTSTLNLKNSLIASNIGGNCVLGGIFNDQNGNLQFNPNSGCGASVPSGDPHLEPLAENGGFTKTHALLWPSAAIDAALSALTDCPSKDQRGVPRPLDGDNNGTATCDIGAFEYQP